MYVNCAKKKLNPEIRSWQRNLLAKDLGSVDGSVFVGVAVGVGGILAKRVQALDYST
jgi:hypothetical protein